MGDFKSCGGNQCKFTLDDDKDCCNACPNLTQEQMKKQEEIKKNLEGGKTDKGNRHQKDNRSFFD